MSFKLDYPSTYKTSAREFSIPNILALTAGPTNVSNRVQKAMQFQIVTCVNPYCYKMMDEIQEMAKHLFQTKNPFTLVVQVSGNGGNETLVTNLVDPGETVIVAVAGVWGQKVVNMAERYGVNVVALSKEPGELYTFEELEEQIIKHKPAVLFVTHGESSGGTLQPLDGLGQICHKHNCLLAVDAVVSLGVCPIFTDRWEIDAINGGTQKGIGAPPGMSLISLSSRAHERMIQKKKPPPYTLDLKPLSDVWSCFGQPRTYHYTYSSILIAAVREALAEICEEGLENVWERHRKSSERLVDKLEKLGLKHFVPKPQNRFWGVSCMCLPPGIKWPVLLEYLLQKYQIEMGFGVGPTVNKAVRIGLLGINARPEIVDYFVDALEDGIKFCQKNGTSGPDTRPEAI